MTKELKLQPGKYYRTRDGRKAYCFGKNPLSHWKNNIVVVVENIGTRNYYDDGSYIQDDEEDDIDIIAEWED